MILHNTDFFICLFLILRLLSGTNKKKKKTRKNREDEEDGEKGGNLEGEEIT